MRYSPTADILALVVDAATQLQRWIRVLALNISLSLSHFLSDLPPDLALICFPDLEHIHWIVA